MKLNNILLLLMIMAQGMQLMFAGYPKKAWTVVVYMAADNDLSPFVQLNLAQMMQVGSHKDLNIVVYLAQKVHGIKTAKKLLVDYMNLRLLGSEPNVDSGAREIFTKACKSLFEEFPSDYQAIIGWDHGSGPLNRVIKGVAYDFTTGNYLTDLDVVYGLQEISKSLGKKIDILAFDACLMAGIELQALFAPYVNYYVASQETIPGSGWNYSRALKNITAHTSAKQLSITWVKSYAETYGHRITDYTLSTVDLSLIPLVAQNVDKVGDVLSKLIAHQQEKSVINFLKKSTNPKTITCFDDPEYDYLDLGNLYSNLLQNISLCSFNTQDNNAQALKKELIGLLREGEILIKRTVIQQVVGSSFPDACGISIYWPHNSMHPSYARLGWSQLYPQWMKLIKDFLRF